MPQETTRPYSPATSTLLILLLVLLLVSVQAADAQATLRIGLLVPGRETASSDRWDELLTARAWDVWMQTTSRGLDVELIIEDGGTTEANTVPALESLLERGVHGIVCCVTGDSAAAASRLARGVPVLALAGPSRADLLGSEGPLVLEPGPLPIARAMTRHARTLGGVGLLTTDDAAGVAIEEAVRAGAVEAGIPVTRVATFPAGEPVLTPEALLVAASEPGAVIVWGSPGDTMAALSALEARGYQGPVYLPWSLAESVTAGIRNGRLRGAFVAVPPVAAADILDVDDGNRPAVENLQFALESSYGYYEASPEGALAFDALELLRRAGEQALVYGVDPLEVPRFRRALMDAVEALGPVDGAAGSYDYQGRSPWIAIARGVEIGVVRSGSLDSP